MLQRQNNIPSEIPAIDKFYPEIFKKDALNILYFFLCIHIIICSLFSLFLVGDRVILLGKLWNNCLTRSQMEKLNGLVSRVTVLLQVTVDLSLICLRISNDQNVSHLLNGC